MREDLVNRKDKQGVALFWEVYIPEGRQTMNRLPQAGVTSDNNMGTIKFMDERVAGLGTRPQRKKH